MKVFLTGFLAISLLFCGCRKPAQTTGNPDTANQKVAAATCPEQFYFYNKEKIPLTVLPKYITVGFTATTSAEEKLTILKTMPAFSKIVSKNQSDAGMFQVVELKAGQTCAEVLQLTKTLQSQPAVLFANPVFSAPASKSADYNWMGITAEFLVTLKSSDDAGDFRNLMTETNTRMVDKLSETSFILAADKNAKGNALEMANYFQTMEWVEAAEPNFHFSNRVDVGNGDR